MNGEISHGPRVMTENGPLEAAHVSIQFSSDDLSRYFFGVSTGVGTLSMTDDEPRNVVM